MWDTYRALHPLYTIMNPRETSDMIKSLILKADPSGWLSIFPLFISYTSTMIGVHVISCFGDAFMKVIDDFEIEKAYFNMRQTHSICQTTKTIILTEKVEALLTLV